MSGSDLGALDENGDAIAYPIGSVGNALQVLRMLQTSSALRVSDVATDLGIARSSAHRILVLLQQFDFVKQDLASRTYRRGPALVEIGLAAANQLPVRRAAYQPIRTLRDVTGETAELCVLDGRDVVVVDVAEGLFPLRVVDDLGDRMPAHLTAAGKAILAAMPPADLFDLFPAEDLTTATGKSIDSRALLKTHLDSVRELGYATNLGESGTEYVGVAAAIVDGSGSARGAVTLALPWARAGDGFAIHLGPQVRRTAESVGAVL
ncbi:IclR family transcriptional regulator (plasmid) [Rhodococcus pyridinivorans]|uniref:IclR family transcriptional regulator n=1 Tax=Rhodococcus pyridinivorans TaxID=103816 RepID=UPI0020C6848C|nr:IclR family transcriptional regulator [Rhodococcus pyridinivorans]UTM39796.1 IclR family transcriptional regulator [Rhodococcus pyridinivorans]